MTSSLEEPWGWIPGQGELGEVKRQMAEAFAADAQLLIQNQKESAVEWLDFTTVEGDKVTINLAAVISLVEEGAAVKIYLLNDLYYRVPGTIEDLWS